MAILAYAHRSTPRWRPRGREEWALAGVAGAFIIGGHHAFLYLGQQHVSGAVAAVVVSLGPVLTALFAVLVLDERLATPDVLGFSFGLLGVFLVAQPGVAGSASLPFAARLAALDLGALLTTDAIGIVLVVLAAGCFAIGAVLTRSFETDLPIEMTQA